MLNEYSRVIHRFPAGLETLTGGGGRPRGNWGVGGGLQVLWDCGDDVSYN